MSSLRKSAIVVGFIPLIIIGLVFGVYLSASVGSGNQSTTTSFNYSGFATSAQTTNSTLGLKLLLTLNSTVLQSGQVLNISISIHNPLPNVNNVSGASDWALPVLQDFSTQPVPCPFYVSFQIFNGYYTESNASTARSPLQLSPSGLAISCLALQRSYYLFQPLDDDAEFLVSTPPPSYLTLPMGTSRLVRGSFSAACCTSFGAITMIPVPPSSVLPFSVGVYTIAAGDEWGQLVLLHFAVVGQ